jgi:hypothetical protein
VAAPQKIHEAFRMTAQILPFRKPSTPQVNPIMEATAAYFIGIAIVGLLVIAVWEQVMGGDTRRRR